MIEYILLFTTEEDWLVSAHKRAEITLDGLYSISVTSRMPKYGSVFWKVSIFLVVYPSLHPSSRSFCERHAV